MCWGWFIGALFLYSCLEYELKYESLMLLISIAGIGLYPLAKWGIECFFFNLLPKNFGIEDYFQIQQVKLVAWLYIVSLCFYYLYQLQ